MNKMLIIVVFILAACSTESDHTSASVGQQHVRLTEDSAAMTEPDQQNTQIDAFQQVAKMGTYFENFGLMRPAAISDLEQIGYADLNNVPGLIIFAKEHPAWAPPQLSLQTLAGEPVLVLTFLSFDISQGMRTEEVPLVYAAGIHGAIPNQLVVRWVSSAEQFDTPLLSEEGEPEALLAEVVKNSHGQGVSFSPWSTPLVYTQFFEQLGLASRPEQQSINFAVAIRSTSSGQKSRAASASSLVGGGARVKIHLPIDQGGVLWGPRSGEDITVYSYAAGDGGIECLIEL